MDGVAGCGGRRVRRELCLDEGTSLPAVVESIEAMCSGGRAEKMKRRGVNLVELLLVVLILGIIASIAIPRASRGARVTADSELVNCLAILRTAIEEYAADHEGRFPGTKPDRTAGDSELFAAQLTKYTSITGEVSETRTDRHRFGPYVHRGIPAVPFGSHRGSEHVAIDIDNLMPTADPSKPVGWIYNPLTGDIIANAEGADEAGQLYCNY